MGWDLPVTPTVGSVATVANFATPVISSLSYLHSSTVQEVFIPPSIFNYGNVYYEWRYPCILVAGGSSFNAGLGMMFSVKIPDDFVSVSSVKLMWSIGSTADVNWDLYAAWVSSGENMSVASHATSNTDDTGFLICTPAGNEYLTYSATTNPLTLSGLGAGDYLAIQVARSTCSGGVGVGTSPFVHGLLFSYTGHFTST